MDRANKKIILSSLAAIVGLYYLYKRKNKKRRWWVRPINRNRKYQGDFNNLVQEMRFGDPDMFFNYTRLSVNQFDSLLAMVGPYLLKKSYRESIPPGARLCLTLRHLAAGDSIPTQAFAYRIGRSTTCLIINEVCTCIWEVLNTKVLKIPEGKDWETIAQGFKNKWNLPNCVGAIDGKHVPIRAPIKSGSQYFNYKKQCSIVLFAVCDYNYTFTYVDIGAYGSQSDGGILRESSFGRKLNSDQLKLPPPTSFPGHNKPQSYFFVGDEAFPLQENLMRPYGGKQLSLQQRIFNYRLSRARRCIENAFGIMVARFRIFHNTIYKDPHNVDKLIMASVCLHNYIKKIEENLSPQERHYCGPTFGDVENEGNVSFGEWREQIPEHSALAPVHQTNRRIGARNAKKVAVEYREYITEYLNSNIGSVPWQNDAINK